MKMAYLIISLLAICCTGRAGTNEYIQALTGEETDRRLNLVTNIQQSVSNLQKTASFTTNVTYSGSLADVGFPNQIISAGFTNASFTLTDLSAYVGTNVALVTLQFYGIAATTVSLRTYGDTNTVDDTSMNSVVIAAGSTADMTVDTDSSGRIDVKATANTSVRLICFIRRHVFQ